MKQKGSENCIKYIFKGHLEIKAVCLVAEQGFCWSWKYANTVRQAQ